MFGSSLSIAGTVDVDTVAVSNSSTTTVTGSYLAGSTFLLNSGTTLDISTSDTARTDDAFLVDGATLRSGEALKAVVAECRAAGKALHVSAANLGFAVGWGVSAADGARSRVACTVGSGDS